MRPFSVVVKMFEKRKQKLQKQLSVGQSHTHAVPMQRHVGPLKSFTRFIYAQTQHLSSTELQLRYVK